MKPYYLSLAIILLAPFLSSCEEAEPGGSIRLMLHDKPLIESTGVRSVRISNSGVFIPISEADHEAMRLLAPNFPRPVLIDVYFGDQRYSTVQLDFSILDFKGRELQITEEPGLQHIIEDAGITVRK